MERIVEDKLNTFNFLPCNDREEYIGAVNDCKMLTNLNRKTSNKEELTYEEYIFLYEVERNIRGFGWERDPRIEKIRSINIIKDKHIAIKILSIDGMSLQYVNEELQNNFEIVKLAVSQNGMSLQYASEELQNNVEIAKLAVSQNGYALQYASEELRNNSEIVKLAVSQKGNALQYVGPKLQNNVEIAKLAVSQNRHALLYVNLELRNYFHCQIKCNSKSNKS